MKKIVIFLILVLVLSFSFTACSKKECSSDHDCFRKGFTAKCIDDVCHYAPIIGQCGNTLCEQGENKCSCPEDCGNCSGRVHGSRYLVMMCEDGECVSDVPEQKVSLISFVKELRLMGNVFGVEIFYNQPFNVRKDVFKVGVSLRDLGKNNADVFVKDLEINARTNDRRKIVLGRKAIKKPLWKDGDSFVENVILDFPTNKLEDELKDLNVVISYDYVYKGVRSNVKKSGEIKVPLAGARFVYVAPDVLYPCPDSCDDGNPATKDFCDPDTHFCVNELIPDACGNFLCESGENKCSCPADCGPCEGDVGKFLSLGCEGGKCVARLKDVVVQQKSILDERSLGAIKLINNFNFNDPFDVNKDKFDLKFSLYALPEDISDFKVDVVRILSGAEELGKSVRSRVVSDKGASVGVGVKKFPDLEVEKSVTLKVWYSYKKGDKDVKGSFSKSIGKVNFVNPR